MATQKSAMPVNEDISFYLRRPVRTLAEAQQDRVLSLRQFAEAEARTKRLAEIASP